MEGEAVAAIIQVLVQNLIDHSKKEISLIRGLDKEAAKLAGSLDTIQQLLNDAESRTIPGGAVKSWLRKLEDVAFDADNVLDELNYHLLSKRINSIKPMKEKVLSCFSSLSHIANPRNIALKIQEINENLEYVRKEGADLGLKERLATNVPTLPTFETDSFSHDPIFIGRDELVSEIVEVINTGTTTDERLISIFAIVGMGGLGKTTLTRNVFHHPRIKTLFGSHLWVHVSQIFDPIILFKKILKELTSSDHDETEISQDILENTSSDQVEDQSRKDFLKKVSFGQVDDGSRQDFVKKNSHDQVEVESRQDILKRLQKALKDKTYLIILDDVWNEHRPKWDNFFNSLVGVTSLKGNAIVVTTRVMEVVSTMQSLHTHELQGLSHEDCWSIIKAKTFGKENDIPLEFEDIGRKIATRCQGLPLAANVVGGALYNKSEEEWLSIEEKWLSHDEGDHITNILKLSFDNLSLPSLKKCFACCSIFPKGRNIKSQELIEYWMAEGFLEANGNSEMECLGDKFMKVLVHNSLLQVAERDDYGNVESCVMHDLVHDLACSISGSSNNREGGSRVRYMVHDEESRIPKEVAKYLRTLLFEGDIYRNKFADFEHLHVLVLADDWCDKLPISIRKLIHLRKLDISLTCIKYLPDWIGELHQMQTLNACTRTLRELPSTLKYLINLRHLYINSLTKLPAEIGCLTSLQTLEYFIVCDKNGCKIEELGSLNGLKGKLEISNLEKVENKEEAEKACLSNKSKILELRLTWNMRREAEATNDENVLEGLQPHSNLKKLDIEGFKGKRFPSWTQNMVIENVCQGCWVPLNKLIEIKLSDCSACEEIPMVGQLPNLKSLYLRGLTNLKSINSSFYGLVNEETHIVFLALERLVLHYMPQLTEWAEVEYAGASDVKVFPNLQHLEISQCKQLMSFPNYSWSCLKSLIIKGSGSMPFTHIFKTELKLLTELWIEGIDDLEYLPNWLFYNNPNLLELNIRKCSNLRELPDGLGTLSSLEKLIISDCSNLERVGVTGVQQSQGSLTCLKRLEICECKALLYFPLEVVGSLLEVLRLEYLSSLNNLPGIIDCLPKFPRLTQLEIMGFSQFMASYSSSRLQIDVSMEGSMETVEVLLQRCNSDSLEVLELKGREAWGSLPESIQHLTSIAMLKIENSGMEELPEWFGNLSSLCGLNIFNCKKLRSLHAVRGLTSLQWLAIRGCPEICVEQQSDAADYSQWPNISHINIILNDGVIVGRRRTLVSFMNGCL
ncbi:putative disease resistance protein RGA3 [Salvia hispanica]|uniref:putative disease resistance protein RGA3 n=1 Tax=Salvia hispanica TaxID=49212 RepID=UPI002009CA92|nr:putative disease resistance protein RGA3 [Salvia hispanica]XP_047939853.1 putative disease resistance protein RGA3 [Salvia hispanica]